MGTSSVPEFLSSFQISEKIGPGFSYHLQIFEIIRTPERGICLSETRRDESFPCARATTLMTWRSYWYLS